MKKLLFVALAAVGMTACVQNEELAVAGGNVAIAFDNAYVYNPTRNANPTTTTESLTGFDVWAFMKEVGGTVLTDEDVTKNGGKWGYANLQYWMPSQDYYFAALAPMNSDYVTETLATGDDAKLGLGTIAFTNVDGTEDLLYAKESVSTPELKDLTEKGMDPVKFQFQHLLSKVKFTFKNGFLTDNMKVVVENVEMSAPAAGSINLAQADYARAWELGTETLDLQFGNVAELAASASAATANERLTIPAKADYTYNVKFGVKVYSGSVLALETTKEATISGYALEMGKAYNFTAVIDWNTLALPAIEFDAAVTEWDTEITTPVGRYVSTIEQLQAALNTPASELGQNETLNIYLGADLAGDVTVLQKKGVNIVLDGCGHEYDGIITVNGDARAAGEETLTIQNVNFKATEAKTFISAPSKIDGRYNYSHNVTIQNCTFTGNYPAVEVGAANFTGTYNLVVKNCVATNMHSALQVTSCDNDVLVDGYVVTGCKGGISVNNTARPVLRNVTIEAEGYGVRGNGTLQNGGVVCNLVVEDATITAAQPIVIRKTTQNYKLTLGENVVLNHTAGVYDVVFTNGDDGTEVVPTGTFSYSSVADFNVFPTAYVAAASTEDFSSAINNPEVAEVNVTSAVDFSTITVNRELELNFNDQASTIGTTAGYGVLAREGADLTINDANFTSVGGAVNAAAGAQVTFNSGDVTINSTQTSQRHIFYAAQDGTVVTVNGGNFTIDAYRQRCYACAQYNAVIYIKGGTFGVAPNHPRWTYPIYTDNGGQVIITGGTFGFDPSEWVAAGYKAEKNGSTWTVVAE